MSGIFGIFNLDGSNVARRDVEAMAKQLERRGPDGTRISQEDNVALGHTLLATTPEALAEALPLRDPNSGCSITADVRLDNREELIAELALGGLDRVIGDGELILRAYLRWGEDCPKHLLGDFAFAIWNPAEQALFCARDHMGMRQFAYHHGQNGTFAFATTAEAVVEPPQVPRRIDETRLADAFLGLEAIDTVSTLFEGVRRLEAAHSLTVTASGLAVRRYWHLPESELTFASDEECDRAFMEIFTEAVRCRLRSVGPVGAMLSGGLDSASVAAVASRLLADRPGETLRCFSAVGPDPNCPETQGARASADMLPVEHITVSHDQLGDSSAEIVEVLLSSQPFDAHMGLVAAVYLAAHRSGSKIVLDGAAADTIMASGNVIASRLRRGDLLGAWREARGEARYHDPAESAGHLLAAAVWAAFAPNQLRGLRRRLRARTAHPELDLLHPERVKRLGLVARCARYDGQGTDARSDTRAFRRRSHVAALLSSARERYDRIAGAVGIEPRDPFLDVRLVSFCASLPQEQLHRDGWPKFILRRAMREMLPKNILWHRRHVHLGTAFTDRLATHCHDLMRCAGQRLPSLFNDAAADQATKQPDNPVDRLKWFKLIVFGIWRSRNEFA